MQTPTSDLDILLAERNQMIESKRVRVILRVIVGVLMIPGTFSVDSTAQKRRPPVKHLSVCGNPNVSCPSAVTFQPYDLPFRMPQSAVIYDTELFYAIILKSVPTTNDNCDNYVAEPERLAAQALFPNLKVFASRCAEPGNLSYSNTNPKTNFMAVYAGTTLAEANRVLATVQAMRKFPGANMRRMRAVMNGT
jgi:hypothetical protein